MLKRVMSTLGVAVLLSGGLVSTVPATASSPPESTVSRQQGTAIDVTLAAKGYRIRSGGGCYDIPFVVRHNLGYLDRFTAEVEVWRGRQFIDKTFDYLYESRGPLRATFFHCVSDARDLGTFRLGPSVGEYNDYDEDIDGTYRDSSRILMKVLQDSRFRRVEARRSGRTRTVAATLIYFDAGSESYRFAPSDTRIRLQRQRTDSWETVDAGRVGRRGRVSISTKAPRSRDYRLLFSETPRTWSAVSKEVRV
jgi:hypothetical protein